jgi:hypothetical protein
MPPGQVNLPKLLPNLTGTPPAFRFLTLQKVHACSATVCRVWRELAIGFRENYEQLEWHLLITQIEQLWINRTRTIRINRSRTVIRSETAGERCVRGWGMVRGGRLQRAKAAQSTYCAVTCSASPSLSSSASRSWLSTGWS